MKTTPFWRKGYLVNRFLIINSPLFKIGRVWNNYRINLFDTNWNGDAICNQPADYLTKPSPVEEIHFTPGTPFFARGKVSAKKFLIEVVLNF